jgi:hypothetical protein
MYIAFCMRSLAAFHKAILSVAGGTSGGGTAQLISGPVN